MSDDKRGGSSEPSMEEILASIRKIISEDTDDSTARGEDRQTDASAAAPQASGSATAEAEAEAEDDEVLDLGSEAEPYAEPETETDGRAGTEVQPAADGAAASDETGDDADVVDLAEAARAAYAEPAEAEPDAAAESPDDADLDFAPAEASASGGATDMSSDDWDPFADPEPTPDSEPEPAPEPAPAAQERASMTAPSGPSDADRTVSRQTEEAAVAELTGLARAASAADRGDDQPKSDVDRILEQMVREALRPQLQDWLDRNLPSLVERIVRQEVRRMTTRAEAAADEDLQD